jgi:hypothetical protein
VVVRLARDLLLALVLGVLDGLRFIHMTRLSPFTVLNVDYLDQCFVTLRERADGLLWQQLGVGGVIMSSGLIKHKLPKF